jgi:D-lyxose ketol-isomerase
MEGNNVILRSECEAAKQRAAKMIRNAGIGITQSEIDNMSIVDMNLSHLEEEGVQVVTFFNTKRVCAKVIVMFPNQTEPEHWHPMVENDPGKEETLRLIWGTCYFYTSGPDNMKYGFIPKGKDNIYTLRHEIIMKPTDQITMNPGEKHWFQGGPEGCVMYSFSSCARDLLDQFTDLAIDRITKIVDEQ